MSTADLTTDERLIRIEALLRANLLHEDNCPAHNPYKGDFAGMFQGMAEKQCDCWISLDRPETDPTKAFGLYHTEKEELLQGNFFLTRYHAKHFLVHTHPELSIDNKAPNYWGKTYMIVPVTLNSATESSE